MHNNLLKNSSLALALGLTTYAPLATASGYHFGTQSVSAQSTANASAAEAADAATIFYNPAGMSKLEGTNISLNANLVAADVRYNNAEGYYTSMAPGAPQQKIKGQNSGKISPNIAAAPHLYATHQINDKFTAGLGIYVPFASGTEYQRDSVLRYNVNKMGLTAIDFNPTLSYKINDNHSVAIGIVGQYAKAELRQYANFGAFAAKLTGNNKLYGDADGHADVSGNDWGFGYTLGYLWDVNDKVRIGASYRSKIEHDLKGSAQWGLTSAYNNPALAPVGKGIQAPITAGGMGYAQNENASVKITTPESLSVHGKFDLDDKWTAFGDVTWTRHSRFNEIKINYENPKVVANAQKGGITKSNSTTLKPNWKDTFKIGIGAAYQYSDKLQLRGGIAYDQSPVRNANYRLSTLPDNDRIWFSLGAKYDFDSNSSIDVGYSYIHIKDAKANVNGWCGASVAAGPQTKNCVSSRTNGSADYKSNAHVFGVQYNHRF